MLKKIRRKIERKTKATLKEYVKGIGLSLAMNIGFGAFICLILHLLLKL